MKNYFKDVIGQVQATKQLSFYLDGYFGTGGVLNPILFLASKGMGKNHLAVALARELVMFDENGKTVLTESGREKKKPFIEVNCSTIRTLRSFIENVLVPYVSADKPSTLFLDEIHCAPTDVKNALLSILNPNETGKTQLINGDYVLDFDTKVNSFIMATSEDHLLPIALKDRLNPVQLTDYSVESLAKIIQKNCADVTFQDEILPDIANCGRGNARQAILMSRNINSYLRGKKQFNKKDWSNVCNALGILKLGLLPLEKQLMVYLKNNPATLTNIAAKMGMTTSACRRSVEPYLLKKGLICIEAVSGRHLTQAGVKYLAES